MARLDDRLAALATMSPAQLREEWQRVYDAPCPRLSPELLRLGIGWRLQEQAHGGVPAKVARSLTRTSDAPAIKPGTRLVRSWNGRTIDVLVVEGGYAFEGEVHRSLSAIARAVTGANWSGPRFFGLTANG